MTPETRVQEARQAIRRIVADIARLSQANLPRQEFFRSFIERTVRAMDAAGGAIWIGRQGRFNLIADVDFESSQFSASRLQSEGIRAALRWTEEHGRPLLIAPLGPQEADDDPGPAGIPNVTPMAFFYVPLTVAERVVGVIQIWQRPGRDPKTFRTFTELLLGVASHAENYLESRQMETAFRDAERLEQLLLVSERMLAAESPQQMGEIVTNLGRDAVGAERLSMLLTVGRRPRLLAASGAARTDRSSASARALEALGRQVVGQGKAQAWRRRQAQAEAPPQVQRFFEQSAADLLIIVPLLRDGRVRGLLAAEYPNAEGAVDQDAALLEALARQVGPALALVQARSAGPVRRLAQRLPGGRLVVVLACLAALLAVLGFVRLPVRIEGRCTVWPAERAAVASLEQGRVVEVYVREGQAVRVGDALLRVESPQLADLQAQAERDLEKWRAEQLRLEAAGDAAGRRIAGIRAERAEREVESLQARQSRLVVRAPQAGVVVTPNVEQLVGAVIGPADRIVDLANLDRWELAVEIPEQDVPSVESALAAAGPDGLPINFVLSSRPDEPLQARLTDAGQLSPVARSAGGGNIVLLRADVESDEARRGQLRMGYQGRARLQGHEKSLLRMAVDPLVDRLRMAWF